MKDLATYHDENRLIHETDRRLHAADGERLSELRRTLGDIETTRDHQVRKTTANGPM
jgi:hypothetical protein